LAEAHKSLGAVEKAQKIMDAAGGNGIYRVKGTLKKGFADATAGPSERWNCELFITEGDSPAGSLKAARKAVDVKYKAVCGLKGKVLDTSDCNADKMMDNTEYFTIFSTMGLGISVNSVIKDAKSPEEAFEMIKKKTRYGKLVIATDKTKVCV
jgi:DNA gyrase/topoisomerase IV subunit B